mmetsp:Transcript_27966/g.80818  ORF Transcript_27966/g.80818 Transcript_27966/m.80818 type:complete len:202 (+) Transcript_27966:53-658(+)
MTRNQLCRSAPEYYRLPCYYMYLPPLVVIAIHEVGHHIICHGHVRSSRCAMPSILNLRRNTTYVDGGISNEVSGLHPSHHLLGSVGTMDLLVLIATIFPLHRRFARRRHPPQLLPGPGVYVPISIHEHCIGQIGQLGQSFLGCRYAVIVLLFRGIAPPIIMTILFLLLLLPPYSGYNVAISLERPGHRLLIRSQERRGPAT